MVRKKNIGELIWPLNLNVVLQVCFHSTPVLVGELQTNFLVYSDRIVLIPDIFTVKIMKNHAKIINCKL